MAYGKAIVASDIPAHRELLKSGSNAVLVNPGHIGEWVFAIKKLKKSRKLIADLGRQGIHYFNNELKPSIRVKKSLMTIS